MLRGFGSERVDNAAHIGGLLVGCLLALILPERISGRHGASEARWRTIASIAAALAITTVVAATAPPARVDVRNAFEAGTAMERALRDFDMTMARMGLEEKAANAGRISQPMLADRQRLVHAPAFHKISADLAAIRLQPGDARAGVLKDLQRMVALMEELTAMPAAFSKGNARVEPIDPARHAAILLELRQLRVRILNWQRAHAAVKP